MSSNINPKAPIPTGPRAMMPSLPANVPTGPRAMPKSVRPSPHPMSTPTGPRGFQHLDSTPPSATAILEKKIAEKIATGHYLALTKATPPFAPWSPLPVFQQHKETRPCHGSFSITHALSCGHTIVSAPLTATSCTPNCVNFPGTLDPAEKAKMDLVQEVGHRVSADAGWDIPGYAYPGMPKPEVDLLGGDFACAECGVGGQETFPAVLEEGFDGVVVVVRGEEDRKVIAGLRAWREGVRKREVEKGLEDGRKREGFDYGVVPKGPRAMMARRGSGRGGGGRGAGRMGPATKIVKARVQEKETVLGRLREEGLVRGLEEMMKGDCGEEEKGDVEMGGVE